jgi:hypothetical protein
VEVAVAWQPGLKFALAGMKKMQTGAKGGRAQGALLQMRAGQFHEDLTAHPNP